VLGASGISIFALRQIALHQPLSPASPLQSIVQRAEVGNGDFPFFWCMFNLFSRMLLLIILSGSSHTVSCHVHPSLQGLQHRKTQAQSMIAAGNWLRGTQIQLKAAPTEGDGWVSSGGIMPWDGFESNSTSQQMICLSSSLLYFPPPKCNLVGFHPFFFPLNQCIIQFVPSSLRCPKVRLLSELFPFCFLRSIWLKWVSKLWPLSRPRGPSQSSSSCKSIFPPAQCIKTLSPAGAVLGQSTPLY